jgi:hypothetical protein
MINSYFGIARWFVSIRQHTSAYVSIRQLWDSALVRVAVAVVAMQGGTTR